MSLELSKTTLAAVALALAILQLLIMLQVRGKLHLFPSKPRDLVRFHKWGGRATLAVATLVGLLCLYTAVVLGYPSTSPQVILHASMGTAAGAVLVAKVVIANWRRSYLRHGLSLGVAGVVLLAGAFTASGGIYVLYLLSR